MKNLAKFVVVAFECSGVIRDAFARQGWFAISVDLKPSETPTNDWLTPAAPGVTKHYVGDVFDFLDQCIEEENIPDLLIAHPVCTYLTSSAEWAYGDGPYHQNVKADTLVGEARREARREALRDVERLWKYPIKKVCIENPKGCINRYLPFMPPAQYIQPFHFGADASKGTGLWLRNLPPLQPTAFVQGRAVGSDVDMFGDPVLPRWDNQTDSGQNKLSPSEDRAADRSRTYPGIADAMAEQWGNL